MLFHSSKLLFPSNKVSMNFFAITDLRLKRIVHVDFFFWKEHRGYPLSLLQYFCSSERQRCENQIVDNNEKKV